MATRLDRLLLLLDTGSTPVIRKTAAQQLGEVQKLHPHELNNLLNKVHSYLFSSQWETRIAAGLAVEAIAKNVSQWNPAGSTFEADNDQQVAGTFSNGNVKLGNFDIRKVLVHGASLLGCHGTEYDVEEDLGIEEKEKLSQQKKQLNRRLGLEVATGVTFPNLNMVDDDDLVERQQSQYGSIQTSIKDLVEEQLVFKPNLSSREKNRAKRKARQTNRQNDGDKRNSDSDNEPALKSRKISSTPDHSMEKTNGDSVVDNTLNMDEIDEWPFEAFCELLMNNLFHPTWEKRHGAATGLREVVKLHGKGAGRCSDSPVTQLDLVNQLWLEDLAVRLVCVLALDRFGDFVTDELVAPVRESCAQALGVTLHHMSLEGIRNVMCILTQLLVQSEWEVRHGGLLGLKYLLAVRQDITESLLQYALPSIFQGIQDPSDDVRAVAASALLPVTDALVQCLPHQVDALVDSLWSILVDLDDLTSSTNSIMMLLSSLLANPAVHSNRPRHMSLTELVPRLWPFLRHNISSVRKAALKTFNTLLVRTASESLPNSFIWLLPILTDSLRHIYQRCLLEDQPEILDNVYEVWCSLLASVPNDHLVACASPFFGPWMCLMMQPPNLPFDSSLLVEIRHTSREVAAKTRPSVEAQIERRNYIGGNSHLVDSSFEKDVIVVHARRIASKLLGLLSLHVSQLGDRIYENQECSQLEMLGRLFVFYLSSKSAVQKFCTAYVIHEWASLQQPNCPCPEIVVTKLLEGLTEVVYYDEIAASFTRLQMECRSFVANLRLRGVVLDSTYSSNSVLSLDQASALSSTVYDSVRQQIRPNFLSAIDEQRSSILTSVGQTGSEQQLLTNRVQCSIAAALVRLKRLPDKMNPIVRPLMDALKHEENIELQGCAANTVSCVVRLCQNKTPCPNSKIIKNLCSQLCSDAHFTPLINSDQGDSDSETGSKYVGILTLSNQQMAAESGRCRRNYSSLKRMTSSSDSSLDATETDESKKQTLIQRRGATLALTAIAKDLAADLPALVPDLWDSIVNPLKNRSSDSATDNLQTLDAKAQDLVRCLQIFEVVGPAIDPSLHNKLIECFQPLSSCLEHAYTAVRHMASRCFAMLTRPLLASTMEYIILNILPWLGASDNDIRRQGATESLALIIEQLGLDVIPYIVLLIVPVLGCMSDLNQLVRLMATNIFAMLIRLMPLDRVDNSLDVNLNESMLKQKVEDRKFLDQLLNPKSIDNYSVPVPINVELRKYQQDGVNWLAFLSRYKLHGILCDDMGLGKTLQSLCVLVGDYSSNQQRYLQTGDVDSKPLPSIVICPPTLTGHWLYEVEKLIGGDILRPLHYVGHPLERARLQKQIDKHNLVLASYDVVRNDIEFFAKIKWNYCILDEGHIIKNSKTKISKAVKQLGCNHRLILSGTPIQNNVLELWSLFDFLMPGFLGTEKQFQASFGKPILLSRDAKSSSKEQEAGALAMEALHRQVLPFLLRRLKEDVLQDLPPKIIQDYYCDLSSLQVKLYEDFSKSQAKKTVDDSVQDDAVPDADVKKPQGAIHIFQALQYLRKVCNHPALILSHDHPEYNHVMDSLNRDSSNIHDLQHATKLVALKQLLNDCGIGISGSEADVDAPVVNQHRVLLFCQMKNMLDILENDLFKLHMPSVTYLRLDGTVPAGNRHQIVNRFNNDPSIDILLLTTHVGGLGLNLTGADTVIFFEHDWNPMKDLQAMDRAHRIGQKKVVTVYRLITRGTLEEKIMGLQKFKMNIANTVINQENYSLASMGTEQLLDLFCLDRGGKPTEKAAAASTATSQQSTKTVLENLGELWDTTQYESEYDLDSFMQGLKHVS